MAYGSAVHLITCLDALVPSRCAADEETAEHLPSWYASHAGAAQSEHESPPVEQGSMMEEKAQQIMKDTFGIALPALRDPTAPDRRQGDEGAQADVGTQKPRHPAETVSEPEALVHHGDNAVDDGGMPAPIPLKGPHNTLAAVLASMPPHLRAVAERRPEWVSQLLQEQRQRQRPSPRPPPPRVSTLSEEDGAYQTEETIHIDPESVSLLRRRTHNK